MEEKKGFVFYETFYEVLSILPDDLKLKFYTALTEYGLFNKEPEFTGIEKALWLQMKFGIDSAKERYARRVENGKKGGAPKNNQNAEKTTENNLGEPKTTENNLGEPKTTENNLNDNDNVNDNVNDKENDDGDDNKNIPRGEKSPEKAGALPPSPPLLSEPQKEYSRVIFEKFRNAGLPCQKSDFFKFQSCDFRLALQKIKGFSSNEVLAAVDNYIFELKNPESYQLREYSFDNFVGSKTFSNCLPANYRTQNFKKYAKEIPKGGGSPPDGNGKQHFYTGCPKCGQRLLEWDTPLQKYKCRSCGAVLAWEEVEDGRNS